MKLKPGSDDDSETDALGEQVPKTTLERAHVVGKTALALGAKKIKHASRTPFLDADKRAAAAAEHEAEMAETLFQALCKLRGTALKLAQVLSADTLFLPEAYVRELQKAQYRVPPLNQAIVRRAIKEELGRSPEELFESFEAEAFAAASLGQVHRARTRDGSAVAVKVQYPGIGSSLSTDLILAKSLVAPLIRSRLLLRTIEEIESHLRLEADYRFEASQTQWFAKHLGSDRILIPRIHAELSGALVLTTEFLDGRHLSEWLDTGPSAKSVDTCATAMLDFFLRSFFVHKRIHADPNLGNFVFLPGERVGVLDFGSIKELSENVIQIYGRLWLEESVSPVSELVRRYAHEGAELDPNLEEDAMAFASRFITPYRNWIRRALDTGAFDFGANPAFAGEGVKLLAAQVFHPALQDFSPDFALVHRTLHGLFVAFTKMKARVDVRACLERALTEAGFSLAVLK